MESFVVKACTPSTTCFIEDSHLDFKYSLQYNCAKNKECDAAGVMHAAFHDDRAVQTDWGLAKLWPRLGVGQAPRFEANASCYSFVVDCATLDDAIAEIRDLKLVVSGSGKPVLHQVQPG